MALQSQCMSETAEFQSLLCAIWYEIGVEEQSVFEEEQK